MVGVMTQVETKLKMMSNALHIYRNLCHKGRGKLFSTKLNQINPNIERLQLPQLL